MYVQLLHLGPITRPDLTDCLPIQSRLGNVKFWSAVLRERERERERENTDYLFFVLS
jgi:hypothetical protein